MLAHCSLAVEESCFSFVFLLAQLDQAKCWFAAVQAGLSWLTILKRREQYRAAFAGFDPQVCPFPLLSVFLFHF